MVKDENRIVLKGNVGRDPRVQAVGQSQVANFSLATKESWKDKNGEWKDETTWFSVVAWKGFGICDFNLITQGQKVLVVGKMRCREYTDRDGAKRSVWEVVASEVDVIHDPKPETAQNGSRGTQREQDRPRGENDW